MKLGKKSADDKNLINKDITFEVMEVKILTVSKGNPRNNSLFIIIYVYYPGSRTEPIL